MIERVEGACVAHSEGLVLGEFDVDPLLIETQLSVCDQPPAGKEEGWCDGRAKSCAESPGPECDNLEDFCPNEANDVSCAVAAAGVEPQGRSAWALSLFAVALAFRRVRAKRTADT